MATSILIFALSFGICLALTPCAWLFASRVGLVDKPDGRRKMQARPIPLAGGIALFFSVAGSLLLVLAAADKFSEEPGERLFLLGLLLAGAVIAGVGLLDDFQGLRGRHKLFGQLVGIAIVMSCGVVVRNIEIFGWHIELGLLAIPFTMFWLLGAINSLNFIDGMDGLLSCVGIIITLTMAAMALLGGHWFAAWVCLSLAGALLGFLPFNFPPAKVFLGDCGSMLIGLVVGVLAIHSSLKAPATIVLAAPLATLAIPIIDAGAAIVRRRLTGASIFMTDRAHIHHCLLRRGLSIRHALFWVSFFCLLTAVGALGSVAFHSEVLAVLTALAVLGILIVTRLFGYTEFLLVRNRILNTLRSFWERPVNGKARSQEIRLQGSADWDELWERLTWEAFELNLKTVWLDVHLPAIQEAYHARWARFDDQSEEAELWRVEIPLVGAGLTVGRLMMTGPRESGLDLAKTVALGTLVEDFIGRLWPKPAARTDGLAPPKGPHRPVGERRVPS